jgi:hypothetical protein
MVLVGTGEVAVQSIYPEALEQPCFFWPETKPVHSGVDHHIARLIERNALPPSNLLGSVEDRARTTDNRMPEIVGTNTVKNGGIEAQRTQLRGFPPGRDEEVSTARSTEYLHDLDCTQAVSVGFNRRASRDARAQL